MHSARRVNEPDILANLDDQATRLLGATEERELLGALAECKQKLASALAKMKGAEAPAGADDPQGLARYIAGSYVSDGPTEALLGAVFRRYAELRSKLALANLRLVAHVAKQFRDRGIAHADLMQEGFCGLLEAIDRFDISHGTKLATYATWWIRQAMQNAVAAGAYPVKLSPRHLRQLAFNQDELDRADGGTETDGTFTTSPNLPDTIQRIHTATRPTLSLDSSIDSRWGFNLLQVVSDPDGDQTGEVDLDETVARLLEVLRPREQEVLALRFGLGGKPRLSLSQVGQVLDVSKERVRQIQDRALTKLRAAAADQQLEDLFEQV